MNTGVTNTPGKFGRNIYLHPVVLGGISILVIGSISTYMLLNPNTNAKPVPTAKIQYGNVTSFVSATGEIDVNTTVDVRTSTPGQLIKLLIRPGSRVKAGDALAELDGYPLAKQNYNTMV